MKIKKLLSLGAFATIGLGMTITLPLVLSSCSNNTNSSNENPISFSGNENPVNPNQPVTITANVKNPGDYNFVWSYSQNDSNWISIPNNNTNKLVIPNDRVTANLNHYQFKLTITNKTNGKIYSATTKVVVANNDSPINPDESKPTLTLDKININNPIAVVNVNSISMSIVATTSNVSNPDLSYQWQYKAKSPTVLLNNLEASEISNGWSNCENGQKATFNIPANKVTLDLNNYEFRCVVTLNDSKNPITQTSQPVSIKTGYAIADSKINLKITPTSPSIIQNQKLSLTASSTTNDSLQYQWYYKQPTTTINTYAVNDVTNTDPITGWTKINCSDPTLNINSKYVTQSLKNTEFMVVGYENDKLTYNTATFTVNEVKQVPITVNITEPSQPIYVGQTIVLTANATADNTQPQPEFTYEWYYASASKAGTDNTWTKIEHQTNKTLTLENVTQEYNNYQFKCKAICSSTQSCGESAPIKINVQQPTCNNQISINFNKQPSVIYPTTENVKIIATASCSNIDSFTYKWWYKKTTNTNYLDLPSVQTPESNGWTPISSCNSDTLTIDSSNVTMDLNNYEFLCQAIAQDQSWNFNYATTKVTVTPTPPKAPEANTNINVKVSGNENVTTANDLTLSASATCTTPSISDFSYQWYYKPVSSLQNISFFKSTFNKQQSTITNPIEGWTKIDTNGNQQKLVIPKAMINELLTKYEFMVVAYQTSNHDNFNLSSPVTINSITQTNITCNETVISNLVNNVMNKLTIEKLKTQAPADPSNFRVGIANTELTSQIADVLGIIPSNIDKIYISPGTKYYPIKKIMLNIQVVLKNNNTFESFSKQSGGIANNSETKVEASGNTLTITNISTNMLPKVIGTLDQFKQTSNDFWTWVRSGENNWKSQLTGIIGKKLVYKEQSKILFEKVANLYQIPVNLISNIKISWGASENFLSFEVWFYSGVACQVGSIYCDGSYSNKSNSLFNSAILCSTVTVAKSNYHFTK